MRNGMSQGKSAVAKAPPWSNEDATGHPHCSASAEVTSCSEAKPSFSIQSPMVPERSEGAG
jgi:hypothetical protein